MQLPVGPLRNGAGPFAAQRKTARFVACAPFLQGDEQIFHVNVTDPQRQNLGDSAAGIEEEQEQVQPPLIFHFWLPRDKHPDLLRGKRQHRDRPFKLWDFELRAGPGDRVSA
jgi:hypothetical protein